VKPVGFGITAPTPKGLNMKPDVRHATKMLVQFNTDKFMMRASP